MKKIFTTLSLIVFSTGAFAFDRTELHNAEVDVTGTYTTVSSTTCTTTFELQRSFVFTQLTDDIADIIDYNTSVSMIDNSQVFFERNMPIPLPLDSKVGVFIKGDLIVYCGYDRKSNNDMVAVIFKRSDLDDAVIKLINYRQQNQTTNENRRLDNLQHLDDILRESTQSTYLAPPVTSFQTNSFRTAIRGCWSNIEKPFNGYAKISIVLNNDGTVSTLNVIETDSIELAKAAINVIDECGPYRLPHGETNIEIMFAN